MGSTFPFGAVGRAAPTISIDSCFRMFVESEIVKAKVDATIWTNVELHCGKKKQLISILCRFYTSEKKEVDVVIVVAKKSTLRKEKIKGIN